MPTTGGGVFPHEPKLHLASAMKLVWLEIVALRVGGVTGERVGKPSAVIWPGNVVPIDRVFLPSADEIPREHAGTQIPEVPADFACDRAVVRVISVVSAVRAADRLPHH